MSKPEHGLGPKHLLFNCGQAGRRGFHFVSLVLTGPTSAETQPSSGSSTGKLIYLLFLTLQIRDRTEQKRPGILGTWQHYLHTIHNVLNTFKMFVFRSKFNTSSCNFVYTINSLSQPCLHGENRDNHAERLYNPASGKEVPSRQELVE